MNYEHAMTLVFCDEDAFHAKLGDVFDKLVLLREATLTTTVK
ncbi:hypothetical protein [uncultured Bacteroides sp.]|nr:hypothetical protein [uncultured Bacteroides sp.]